MEKMEFGGSPKEAPLEYLQKIIKNAPERIKKEYATTENTWLSCLITVLTIIRLRMLLHKAKLEELLSPEVHKTAMAKLAALERRVKELKKQYPQKETDPPDKIKEELLKAANIFEQ